jgi:hypothetical protein
MWKVVLVATSAAAAQVAQGPPEQVVTAGDINRLAAAVRTFTPKDEFAALPRQPSVDGKRFVIEIKPLPTSACSGYPMWEYEASENKLCISVAGGQLNLNAFLSNQGDVNTKPRDIWGDPVRYFATECSDRALPSYRATNGYGTSYKIDPTVATVTAIADSFPETANWPGTYEMTISGDQARSLVPSLRIRFTGTLSDWKPGTAIACASKRDGPTGDSPYDRRLNICLLHGHIDKLEIVDIRDGHTIHSDTNSYKPKSHS